MLRLSYSDNTNCYCSDLTKKILARLDKTFTGSTLARIAVEVLEEEDVKLLVQSGYSVDWKETAENEDPAILWALKNDKFDLVQRLLESPDINLDIEDRDRWSFIVRAISKKNLGEKTRRVN